MAAFATLVLAEARARAKVKDKTWVNAHSQRNKSGVISVRVQRYMSPTNRGYGGWVEITDDATA